MNIPLILVLIIAAVNGCNILATLESQTNHKVFVQVHFFNKTKSPVYEFESDKDVKEIRLNGLLCNLNPTKIEVYTKYPEVGVKPKGTSEAFLEGIGMLNYVILQNAVFMGTRVGVSCAAGDCGSSRG